MIEQRFKILEPYIIGKKVLDIGACDDYSSNEESIRRANTFINSKASSVLAIDNNLDRVLKARQVGVNAFYENAESFNLYDSFDVIFAGELIEHLENAGMFLQSCKKHLAQDGFLIITTPNCFGFRYIFRFLFGCLVNFKEHTCFYDMNTLSNICEKHFLIHKKIYSFGSIGWRYRIEKFISLFKKSFSPTLVIILKKGDKK